MHQITTSNNWHVYGRLDVIMTSTLVKRTSSRQLLTICACVNWAGHQQLSGSPTYCLTVTSTVKTISSVGVCWRFSRSTKSSSARSLYSWICSTAFISFSIAVHARYAKWRHSSDVAADDVSSMVLTQWYVHVMIQTLNCRLCCVRLTYYSSFGWRNQSSQEMLMINWSIV